MEINLSRQIYGIGVDICNVGRLEDKLCTHGDKFAKRILTAQEYALYEHVPNKARYLSKCWAVKEAVVKAFGCGFSGNFMWRDIGYCPSDKSSSRPTVSFSYHATNDPIMKNKVIHLSVSDEIDNVIAFVTIEKEVT